MKSLRPSCTLNPFQKVELAFKSRRKSNRGHQLTKQLPLKSSNTTNTELRRKAPWPRKDWTKARRYRATKLIMSGLTMAATHSVWLWTASLTGEREPRVHLTTRRKRPHLRRDIMKYKHKSLLINSNLLLNKVQLKTQSNPNPSWVAATPPWNPKPAEFSSSLKLPGQAPTNPSPQSLNKKSQF